MFTHRFREQFATPTPVAQAAFLPCPLFAAFTPTHRAFVADVYRVAREMTEARAARPAPARVPTFSLN